MLFRLQFFNEVKENLVLPSHLTSRVTLGE